MSRFVPVGTILAESYCGTIGHGLLDGLQFVPLTGTEIHVVSHHYPICVRTNGTLASLCAILESSHLARPLVDGAGRWNGCYKPIALRCAPFRLRQVPTGDPLMDLEIWEGSLASRSNVREVSDALPICNGEGKLSRELGTYYSGLRHVQVENQKLEIALDQLFLAGLLNPLAEQRPTVLSTGHATLSDPRFEVLTNRALEGMARQTFAGIEVAVAMIFSQMHLARDLRPAFVERLSLRHLRDDAQANDWSATALEGMDPWLDESDLFSLDNFVGFDQLPETFAK